MKIWDKYLPSQQQDASSIGLNKNTLTALRYLIAHSPEYRQIISISFKESPLRPRGWLVDQTGCIVWLHHCIGDFWRWNHWEGFHNTWLLSAVSSWENTLLRQSSKPWTHEQTHTHQRKRCNWPHKNIPMWVNSTDCRMWGLIIKKKLPLQVLSQTRSGYSSLTSVLWVYDVCVVRGGENNDSQ